jgi:hypothetical protein
MRPPIATLLFVIMLTALLGTALGALMAVSPGTAARLSIILLVPFVVIVAWTLPDVKDAPDTVLRATLSTYVLTTMLWPKFAVFRFSGFPALSPQKLALATLLIVWAVSLLISADMRIRLRERIALIRPLLVALIFLAAWRLLTVFSGDTTYWYFPLKTAISEILAYYLPFFVGLSALRSLKDVRAFLFLVCAGVALVCALAVYEAAISKNLFANYISLDEDYTGRLTETVREKYRAGKYRVQASFEHPLVLAEFLVVALPILVYLTLTTRRLLARILPFVLIPLSAFVVYKTDSRAGMSALIVIAALTPMLHALRVHRERRDYRSTLGLLVIPAVLVASPLLAEIIFGVISGEIVAGSAAADARAVMLHRGLPLILDQPLLGYGVDRGGRLVGVIISGGLYSIDNYFLSLALDSGLPAFLCYSFVLGYLALQAGRLAWHLGPHDRSLAVFLLLSVVGFGIMRAILSIPSNAWIFFLLGACIVVQMSAKARASSVGLKEGRCALS